MKKICLVLVAVFMTLLVSGCGKERKLTCIQTPDGVNIEFNIGFKGKTIKTMDFNYDYDISSLSDKDKESVKKQDFCVQVKEAMKDYEKAFTNCKSNVVKDHLKVAAVLDINKIAKNALQKMTSVENAKTELEKQGYSCTIK